MSKRDILKKIVISFVTLMCLTALLMFLFRDNMANFSAAFKKLSLLDILCLTGMGLAYQMLDGLICHRLVHNVLPRFRYRHALEVTYLSVFGNVSTFAAGTIPMQAYYLHRCGVDVGRGVGIMTLEYVLHKTSVVLFASIMLFAEGQWLHTAVPDVHGYIIAGYLICLGIICVMVLLCTWERAHRLALWLLGKVPDRGKWRLRSQKFKEQLDCLYIETKANLKNKKVILFTFLVNCMKLSVFCAVPSVCMRILGENVLSLGQAELLTALMLLITNAIPNIAGIGPTEFAFLLLFEPLLGSAAASSSLLFFRITTYYLPFLISIFFFLTIQIRLFLKTKNKSEEASQY